ncbi:BREVIS RADIX-like 4 [Actinidia rufa]|uniref:BREVIS RADIX-like 4 n=1 Tax=Actinidia rufa TaxID=165716 RepID=A0A7J0DVC1_9ERIC|nr:BREVIS RADIX-like 4 [Actinidia rufa]
MAWKASGAYRNCNPCPGTTTQQRNRGDAESDSVSASEKFRWSYRRTASSNSSSGASRQWGEGDGGEAEGNLERRWDAGVGEWASGRPGGVRGGERAQGVGRPSGARSPHHLRLDATWR